jgi:hypothetical protein
VTAAPSMLGRVWAGRHQMKNVTGERARQARDVQGSRVYRGARFRPYTHSVSGAAADCGETRERKLGGDIA